MPAWGVVLFADFSPLPVCLIAGCRLDICTMVASAARDTRPLDDAAALCRHEMVD
jgi:hypothetical protein